MKYQLTVLILFSCFISSAQDYKLFDADSKKLYTTYPIPGLTCGIEFDSVVIAGDFTVYFNYTGIGDELESDTCEFWGGPTCLKQDRPSWLGYAITLDFMGTYHFMTYQDDFLSFNFNILPGDSSLFYQDESQFFYMIYEGADTATILDITDSAKYYRIANYDISGNTIDSPLNGEQIIIGKEMGLAGFFRIDSFPIVQQPLSLIGNFSPSAGITSLTNEMVYDHQPGDEIQYIDQYFNYQGPPYLNYLNYIKHIFLDRTELPDSISYTVDRIIYKTDSNIILHDTINLNYNRNTIIAEIPFGRLDQEHSLVMTKFYKADYCELNLWSYSIEPQYLAYCPADNCWGSYDIPGPPPDEETIYVCGLGLYLDRSAVSAPPPEGYSHTYLIIYFKKNGVECGEEVIVNIDDPPVPASRFSVYPNPAKDKLCVRTTINATGTLIISDLKGRQLKKFFISGQATEVNIDGLNNGLYLVKMFNDSFVEVKKIMIAR